MTRQLDLEGVEAQLLLAFRHAFEKKSYLQKIYDAHKADGEDGVREIMCHLSYEVGNAVAGIAGAMSAAISNEDEFAKNKKAIIDGIANIMLYVLAIQDKKPELFQKELEVVRKAFGVPES